MARSRKSKNSRSNGIAQKKRIQKPGATKSRVVLMGVQSCLGGNAGGCELGPTEIRRFLLPLLKKGKIHCED
ncbi:MAG TPA: hypothetical protein VI588_02715, partial [Candidatus Gracilibacteria bacterium]|nr:hypothetical protein [Candidatus Gracilibacteria bacterium]